MRKRVSILPEVLTVLVGRSLDLETCERKSSPFSLPMQGGNLRSMIISVQYRVDQTPSYDSCSGILVVSFVVVHVNWLVVLF